MSASNGWQLDRHVNPALILTILVQTGAFIWWAAGVNARVDHLERQALASGMIPERIAKLETKVDVLIAQLAEIQILVRQRGR